MKHSIQRVVQKMMLSTAACLLLFRIVAFAHHSLNAEFDRLRGLGVEFTQKPTAMGPVTTAVLDDTCGNLIQIAQQDA